MHSAELLLGDGLIDFDILVRPERNVSGGVEFDGSLGEDTASSFLFLVFSQLKLTFMCTHWAVWD